MARADTPTLLPLDRFAQIVGIHPLHFNQAALAIEDSEDTALDPANCGKIIVQQPWQADDALSREEMAIAISTAESNMAQYLGFEVAPKWNHEELVLGQRRRGVGCGLNNLFTAQRGYILQAGVEAKDLIESEAAITFSDADGDGYAETATITVTTTVSEPDEIALYYPGMGAADTWEIRPIHVVIEPDINLNGFNIATITVGRHQLVQPALLSAFVEVQVADGLDDNDFLDVVDVYRHWNDPSSQGSFLWNARVGYCGCLPPATCTLCAETEQSACLSIVNARLGHVRLYPGTWDDEALSYTTAPLSLYRSPERALLSYRAGYTAHGRSASEGMATIFERAVTMYALSLMDRPICGCAGITAKHENARLDLSENSRDSAAFGGEDTWSRSLFGFRRGAVEAWQLVERMAIGG